MIDEVNRLVQILDISAADAEEIINVFFEFYTDTWTYIDFLYKNIRVVRDTEENQPLIAEIETIDDICLYKGDDYVLITNYDSLVRFGDMSDVLTNPF